MDEAEFINDQFLVMDQPPPLQRNGDDAGPSLEIAASKDVSESPGAAKSAGQREEEQDAYAVAVAAMNAANAAAAAGVGEIDGGGQALQVEQTLLSSLTAGKRKKKKKRRKENKSSDAVEVNGGEGGGDVDVIAQPLSSSSPVMEKGSVVEEKKRKLDTGDGSLDSSPVTTNPVSQIVRKRKKKNRQTSQEEESAQALLALNKGLAKNADNENAIAEEDEEDEEDETEDDAARDQEETIGDGASSKDMARGNKPTRTVVDSETTSEGQEKIPSDGHADDQHFLVPADEDVEMAEAAMAVTAATASAALNSTAAMELSSHVLDPAHAHERTLSEHLAAHLAKVDPPVSQPPSQQPTMTDDMLVEHRLAVQLQQNGYAAPAMDGHGFVSVNQAASGNNILDQMDSRGQKKRKRQHLQPDAGLHTEHGLMVDPQLMQLDGTTGFTLDHTPQPNDPPTKRPRSGHEVSPGLHEPQTTEHISTQGVSTMGLPNPLLRPGWKTVTYSTGDLTHGGTFSLEERHAVDMALHQYCIDNDMTMDQLRERVWGNNRRKDEFWDTICNAVPNRSRASVYKHVRRTCHIFQQRAKWNAEEDEELAMLVAEKGNKWKDIGQAMGRMGEDCRDRYRNYVKCGKDRGTDRWSKEEEDLLTATVNAHKEETKRMLLMENKPLPSPEEEDFHLINWTTVSDLMKNRRSRIQCRYKWKKMITQREKQDKAPVGITYEGGKRKKVSYSINQMLPGDKYWLLKRIQATMANKEGEIPWDDIAKADKDVIGIWSQKDLKVAYRELRKDLPFRRRPLRAILDLLLQHYESLPEDQRTARFHPTEADRDAAAAATVVSSTQPAPSHQQPPSSVADGKPSVMSSEPSVSGRYEPICSSSVGGMNTPSVGSPTSHHAHGVVNNPSPASHTTPVLDPVLMAGGALDELEKSHSYNAGLEAAVRVVRNAMQAQQQAAAASSAVGGVNNGALMMVPGDGQQAGSSGDAGDGVVEGESQEEQELRRRLLGGMVTDNMSA
ncbi:hypothetical protein EX30DRAFT_368091 [Ascodesmis nigricans]|uniref:Uncharacterized protein n=1 Tax=Ascodesmis nigricans TaxID=341454 RepID=A0A4S2N6Q8_9PEZI|nr:hypothetical protein EX30DRAFT_368091 [Ascodesmis nigricans]